LGAARGRSFAGGRTPPVPVAASNSVEVALPIQDGHCAGAPPGNFEDFVRVDRIRPGWAGLAIAKRLIQAHREDWVESGRKRKHVRVLLPRIKPKK